MVFAGVSGRTGGKKIRQDMHGIKINEICFSIEAKRLRTTDIGSSDDRHVPIDPEGLVLNHIGIGHTDDDAIGICRPSRIEGQQCIEEK